MPSRSRPGAGPAIAAADEALLRAAGLQRETDRAFAAAKASGWGRGAMDSYRAAVEAADQAAADWQELAAAAAETEMEAG